MRGLRSRGSARKKKLRGVKLKKLRGVKLKKLF